MSHLWAEEARYFGVILIMNNAKNGEINYCLKASVLNHNSPMCGL